MKKKFNLEDLDCANCAAKMEAAIKEIPGVINASVNFLAQKLKSLTIQFHLNRSHFSKCKIGHFHLWLAGVVGKPVAALILVLFFHESYVRVRTLPHCHTSVCSSVLCLVTTKIWSNGH